MRRAVRRGKTKDTHDMVAHYGQQLADLGFQRHGGAARLTASHASMAHMSRNAASLAALSAGCCTWVHEPHAA